MKRIVTYKVFESAGSGLTQDQEKFLDKYTQGRWSYNPATGLVDVEGYFDCEGKKLKTLSGVKFGKVTLDFDCSNNSLSSLEGSPREVGRHFDCSNNKLTSLEASPREVGGHFLCENNDLTSLEGSPREVGIDFDCSNNKLTSLKGAPQRVGWSFKCSGNKLTTLEGAPQEVRYFTCDLFEIVSEEWNIEGWLEILTDGSEEAQSLILTILTPEVLNQEIQNDPGGMIRKLKVVWNDPKFQDIRKQLQFPAEFGDVDKTIKSLKKLDDIKDLI